MDGDVDPFAAILQLCHATRSQEVPLRDPVFVGLPETSSGNKPPVFGPIPADSLGDYLCSTPPEASNNHDEPCSTPPVDSFLSPPPPEGSLLAIADNQGIPAVDHHHCHGCRRIEDIDHHKNDDKGTMAVDGGFTYTADTGKVSDLSLSQLKSMARLDGFFRDVVSFITKFRFSEYWVSLRPIPSKKRNLGSSSNLKEKVSISCEPPKKRKNSGNILGLESLKFNSSGGLIDADAAFEVGRSESSSEKKDLGLSSKLKGKDVSAEFPSKKQKYSEYTSGLKSSKCNISSVLVETDGVTEIVLSDSEAEEESGGASGLGDPTVKDGMPWKECEVGSSKADGEAHNNAEGSSLSTKHTEDFGKSKFVGSGGGTCLTGGPGGVVKKNAETSSIIVKMLFDVMKIAGHAQPEPFESSGDADDDNDFLKTAVARGMTFPRPRWWPPEGFGEY